VLPNCHLHVRFPNCVRIRSDGTNEVAGIVPDIEIAPIEGEDAKARAKRTIDELYTDLRAR
jgi:hypothetical protein